MKCLKHGCKIAITESKVGWGNESKFICPECEKEELAKADENHGSGSIFSTSSKGWGSK